MRKDCERDAVHAWVKAKSQSGDQARGCGFGSTMQGDFYVIPAGVAHEFLNRQKALSIAWNLVPVCTQKLVMPCLGSCCRGR